MKLKNIVSHPRFKFWTRPLLSGFGFVARVGKFNISASIVRAHRKLRAKSHVLFTWFHFGCYVYVCIQVIRMAYEGSTDKSINWGLIAILIKPTDEENKIIGK